jgi:hypothetical protein
MTVTPNLVALTERTEVLVGIEEQRSSTPFIISDSLLRPVYGHAKQGPSYGHTKIAGTVDPGARCGLSPKLRQIRSTAERLSPERRAINARDQCEASPGVCSNVNGADRRRLAGVPRGPAGPSRRVNRPSRASIWAMAVRVPDTFSQTLGELSSCHASLSGPPAKTESSSLARPHPSARHFSSGHRMNSAISARTCHRLPAWSAR